MLEEAPLCPPGKFRELLPAQDTASAQDTQLFCGDQILPSLCLALALGVTVARVVWTCLAEPGRGVNPRPCLHPQGTDRRCAHLAFCSHPTWTHLQATQQNALRHSVTLPHLPSPSHRRSTYCTLHDCTQHISPSE